VEDALVVLAGVAALHFIVGYLAFTTINTPGQRSQILCAFERGAPVTLFESEIGGISDTKDLCEGGVKIRSIIRLRNGHQNAFEFTMMPVRFADPFSNPPALNALRTGLDCFIAPPLLEES